jgi:hypothetical protein
MGNVLNLTLRFRQSYNFCYSTTVELVFNGQLYGTQRK